VTCEIRNCLALGTVSSSIDDGVDRASRCWPRDPTDATYFPLQLKCGAVQPGFRRSMSFAYSEHCHVRANPIDRARRAHDVCGALI
jgi:hypothetical protein